MRRTNSGSLWVNKSSRIQTKSIPLIIDADHLTRKMANIDQNSEKNGATWRHRFPIILAMNLNSELNIFNMMIPQEKTEVVLIAWDKKGADIDTSVNWLFTCGGKSCTTALPHLFFKARVWTDSVNGNGSIWNTLNMNGSSWLKDALEGKNVQVRSTLMDNLNYKSHWKDKKYWAVQAALLQVSFTQLCSAFRSKLRRTSLHISQFLSSSGLQNRISWECRNPKITRSFNTFKYAEMRWGPHFWSISNTS